MKGEEKEVIDKETGEKTMKLTRPNMLKCVKVVAPYLLELVKKDKTEKEQAFKMKLEAQKSPKKKAGNGKGSKK